MKRTIRLEGAYEIFQIRELIRDYRCDIKRIDEDARREISVIESSIEDLEERMLKLDELSGSVRALRIIPQANLGLAVTQIIFYRGKGSYWAFKILY